MVLACGDTHVGWTFGWNTNSQHKTKLGNASMKSVWLDFEAGFNYSMKDNLYRSVHRTTEIRVVSGWISVLTNSFHPGLLDQKVKSSCVNITFRFSHCICIFNFQKGHWGRSRGICKKLRHMRRKKLQWSSHFRFQTSKDQAENKGVIVVLKGGRRWEKEQARR